MAIRINPQRRRLNFKSWREALADIDHLQRAGYDRAGNWDLSQTVDHIGEGLRTALRGSEHRAAWVIRKFLGPIILRRIVRQRRMKAGIKVPAWWLPGPASDESTAINRFRDKVAAFEAMTTPPFPHPLFGAMTKQQCTDLALIHAAHHLSFLVRRERIFKRRSKLIQESAIENRTAVECLTCLSARRQTDADGKGIVPP